ncbi:MAG: MFS transporter [Candidatus Saccharimonadales bacterium]
MKGSLKSTTRKLYAFSFFDNFLLIYPFYVLLVSSNGISASQITLLLVAWSVSGFLLEIPSGILADKYSRKLILIIGILAKATGFLIWLIWPTFWGYMAGFILWGVKSAFTSGTKEALVYDELARYRKQNMYTEVIGRIEAFMVIAIVFASVAASYFVRFGYSKILVLSIISLVISAASIALITKAPKREEVEDKNMFRFAIEGLKFIKKDVTLQYLTLSMSLIVGLAAIEEYFALLMKEKGLANSSIALWSALIYISAAVGNNYAYKIKNFFSNVPAAFVFWAFVTVLATFRPSLIAPVAFAAYMFYLSVTQIKVNSGIQQRADSKMRATLTSVSGLGSQVFSLFAYLVIALVSRTNNYGHVFRIYSLVLLLIALMIGMLRQRVRVDNHSSSAI